MESDLGFSNDFSRLDTKNIFILNKPLLTPFYEYHTLYNPAKIIKY